MRLTPHRLKPVDPVQLRPGDHIAVRRPEAYVHHGIYLGEGRVAHFTDEAGLPGKMSARVIESPLEDFLRGGRLLRRRHHRALPPETVIERARAVVNGEMAWRPYHLVHNNCEHFATFCASGGSRSVQVRQVAGVAFVTTALLATAVLKKGNRPRL